MTTNTPATYFRTLASGNSEAEVDIATGRVVGIHPLFQHEDDFGPTCCICDGIGHGYPGAGPCPLEESGHDDGFDAWEAGFVSFG